MLEALAAPGIFVMTRTTLKLGKSKDASTAPKPLSSRARRALPRHSPAKQPTVAAAPPAEATAPADAREAGERRETVRSRSGRSRPGRSIAPRPETARSEAARSEGSGNPRSQPPAAATKAPPRHENPDDPRLSKRMSELGLCSRREADEW